MASTGVPIPQGATIGSPTSTGVDIPQGASVGAPNAGLAPPAEPEIDMQESPVPGMVQKAGAALPVIGGMAGGILGAGAGGVGAIGGAGVGSMLGEEGRQAINQITEGPEPQQQSTQELLGAGAIGAGSQLLGGAAIGLGSKVLNRIVAAKSAQEVGNVMQGLLEANPKGFSAGALKQDIAEAIDHWGDHLGRLLRGNTLPGYVDPTMLGTKAAAHEADIAMPSSQSRAFFKALENGEEPVGVVERNLNRVIEAAKVNVGVKGQTATPEQLFKLQQAIREPNLWEGVAGPIREAGKKALQAADHDLGQQLRLVAPEVDAPLRQLTNLHAAEDAIKNFRPTNIQSTAATAALNPKTTAAISPAATAAGVAGSTKVRNLVKDIAGQFIP